MSQAWTQFLGRIPWEVFATLTIEPKHAFPVSRDLASREAFWWCGSAGHLFRRPVGWVYVVERGTSGSWHAHALLAGTGDCHWTALRAMWRQRNGLIDVQRVSDARRAALYTSKSITDDEAVLSDTLGRFRSILRDDVVIEIH